MCAAVGLTVLASDADHVIPHGGDLKLFFDPNNLQSLCHDHHGSKSRMTDQLGKETVVNVKGCDASGLPLDPNHFWRKTK
jgi:5-methylcytosine-specific restriction enzyme A